MDQKVKISLINEFLTPIAVVSKHKIEELLPFLHHKKLKKGTLIREENQVENCAHLILSGTVGLMKNGKLLRPFFKNQVAYDQMAYEKNLKSMYEIRALTASHIITVTRENEQLILQNIPEFRSVSLTLKALAQEADKEWHYVTNMHYSVSLPYLKNKLNIDERNFTRTQLCQMIGVNPWTIKRFYKFLYENRNSIKNKTIAFEYFNYPFKSIIHPDVEEIDVLVRLWTKQLKLIPNQKLTIAYQKMKMSWLAARLYPEIHLTKAVWIGKLYALLFVMDDYIEQIEIGKKHHFWEYMILNSKNIFHTDPFLAYDAKYPFPKALYHLWQELQKLGSLELQEKFKNLLTNYLKDNLWEALNLDQKRIPEIHCYLQKRPIFSGGLLALCLIPFALEQSYPDIHQIWPQLKPFIDRASKLIYISNDLLSFDKEKQINDPHNWIALLMHHQNISKDEAFITIVEEHHITLAEFIKMDDKMQQHYLPNKRTHYAAIKAIKYQICGALDWSLYDTNRYILNYR